MKDVFKISTPGSVSVLLYHQVGVTPNIHTNLDCFCSLVEFYGQMEFLMNSNYKVVPLTRALDLIFNNRILDDNYVVLTFDDGCQSFYDIVFPILEKMQFPASIYPVAGYLGKYASWNGINSRDLKILSKSMLIELNKCGVEIGAHTMDHVKLTRVKKNDAIKQIQESKQTLEQLLGNRVCSFAYPHGDFDTKIIEIVKDAGYKNALTCVANCAEEAKSIFEIPRKYITYFDNLEDFKQKLN